MARRRAGVRAVLAAGDVASLEALRDRLASELDSARTVWELTALSSQFVSVVVRLRELRPAGLSRVDAIVERRRARLAAAGIVDAADCKPVS